MPPSTHPLTGLLGNKCEGLIAATAFAREHDLGKGGLVTPHLTNRARQPGVHLGLMNCSGSVSSEHVMSPGREEGGGNTHPDRDKVRNQNVEEHGNVVVEGQHKSWIFPPCLCCSPRTDTSALPLCSY